MPKVTTTESLSPLAKATAVNADDSRYGTFAEIGAGQEVARYFFLAGKASHTIAKTISAYDMTFSDEIYGREENGRYVCESRLNKMLDKEFGLLIKRLQTARGEKTKFFAFANTVTTGTSEVPRCRGWMGVRFQTHPLGQMNEIILHVRMMDRHRLQQQESLGILGVNLVHGAFYRLQNASEFILALVENLKEGQVFIDVLKMSGPDLAHFDNRLLNLELVRRGLAEAILFGPKMELLNIGDEVYGKSLLIQRGHYHPITKTHSEVLHMGLEQMRTDLKTPTEILTLNEITMLPGDPQVNELDYLQRLEILAAMGLHVLITQFPFYYQLKSFFHRYTRSPLTIVMSASHLAKIFAVEHYQNLEGGIFEGLGKLLDAQSKLFVYPYKNDHICLTAKTFTPAPSVRHLYEHFLELGQIVDISKCENIGNTYHSEDIQKMIEQKDARWETLVPVAAREYIKKHKVFGYRD